MAEYETDGSSALDPNYSDLDETWRDTSPDFASEASGQDSKIVQFPGNPRAAARAEQNASGTSAGRASEDGASGKITQFPGGQDGAREAENSPGGFKNSVIGRGKGEAKGKGKGRLKKLGPIGLLMLVLAGGGALITGSQFLAPFALLANGMDMFNSIRTSMNTRNNYMMKFSLGQRNKSITTGGIFSTEKLKISTGIAKKMNKQGITYVEQDGLPRMLVYQDPDTQQYLAVVASETDVGSIPSSIDIDGVSVHIDQPMDLDTARRTNDNFDLATDRSTRTLKGHIAGWFDDVSAWFHKRISNNRNRHKGKEEKTDEEIIEEAKSSGLDEDIPESDLDDGGKSEKDIMLDENNEDTLHNAGDAGSTDFFDVGEEEVAHYNADGDLEGTTIEKAGENIRKQQEDVNIDVSDALDSSMGSDQNAVTKALNSRAGRAIAAVGQKADMACTMSKTMDAISMAISGIVVYKIINFVTDFFEVVQGTQVGDRGNDLHYYANGFTTRGVMYGADGETVISEKSTFESPAFLAQFGGSPVSGDSDAALKYNVESIAVTSIRNLDFGNAFANAIKDAAGYAMMLSGNFGTSTIGAYQACLGANAVNNIIGAASVIGDFIAGGPKKILEGLVKGWQVAVAMGAIGLLITLITPYVARWLATDLVRDLAGEDAAYAINSGTNIYLGRQMQAGSGLPGNEAQVAAMYRETQRVIAEEAKYDRMTHSPFDITNKNTFFGSIAYSLVPMATSLSYSPLNVASQIVNQAGTSALALFPSVRAASEEVWYDLSLNKDCPSLSQLDLVGDAYCNPYFVTDLETMDMDPAEVFEQVCAKDAGNFEKGCDAEGEQVVGEDGTIYEYTPEIKDGGELSKWVIACATRDASFGKVDANTLYHVIPSTGSVGLDTAINLGTSLLPGVGNIIGLVENYQDAKNLDWSTGENCVDPEYSVYSRYSEDQRYLEAAGLIEESGVSAYLNKYYEANPIDNSYEGIIARYSGLTKEAVEDVFAILDYVQYIAEYDPEERVQFAPRGNVTLSFIDKRDSRSIVAIISKEILYFDLRTRNYAA